MMQNLQIYNMFYSLACSCPKISLRPHSAPSAPEPERKLKGNRVWLRGWRKEHRLSVQPNYSRSSGSKRTAYLLRTFPCLDSILIHESVIALNMMKFKARLKKSKSAACTPHDIIAPSFQMSNLPLQETMARQNVVLPWAKKTRFVLDVGELI